MRLTQQQFESERSQNKLRIALIGMSNIGKSYWAQKISARHGFEIFEADKAIQKEIGLETIYDTAQWMGHPYEQDYKAKAKRYLDVEGMVTLQALALPDNQVLDSTGSVVHLEKKVVRSIKTHYLVVYLQANPTNIDVLIERFSSSPKPLIWGEYFTPQPNLSRTENLMASYPNLLKTRADLYENLADITLNVSRLDDKNVDFLDTLYESLPV